MPIRGVRAAAWRVRGEAIRSARKDAGRKSVWISEGVQLKAAPAVVLEITEREEPRRIEVTGGGDKDWTISQV